MQKTRQNTRPLPSIGSPHKSLWRCYFWPTFTRVSQALTMQSWILIVPTVHVNASGRNLLLCDFDMSHSAIHSIFPIWISAFYSMSRYRTNNSVLQQAHVFVSPREILTGDRPQSGTSYHDFVKSAYNRYTSNKDPNDWRTCQAKRDAGHLENRSRCDL